jgi:hypothetical protein
MIRGTSSTTREIANDFKAIKLTKRGLNGEERMAVLGCLTFSIMSGMLCPVTAVLKRDNMLGETALNNLKLKLYNLDITHYQVAQPVLPERISRQN